MEQIHIRPQCLTRYANAWQQPSPEEIREVLRRARLTGAKAAELLGIADGRTIRRWTGGNSVIPYSAWAILCEVAGLGKIWQ